MITVVGIGEDGLDGLALRARQAIAEAQVLAGGARHQALVSEFTGVRVDWSQGIEAGLDALAAHVQAGKRVVVLGSGDPLYFGIGNNLISRFGAAAVLVVPAPGAVSLACAAMGWSQADVQVVTLHGRPLESLNRYLAPGMRVMALTHDGETPTQVAALLTAQGYGASRLSVLEHLGGPLQRRIDGVAQHWNVPRAANLNTLAIELIADSTARPLTRLAGLPDDAFVHDGQLTKRAVRAVTLSSLAPLPGQTLWDLGAGAGSIAIEWMRAHESCQAVAVERDAQRAERIRLNADSLGVPRLKVHLGDSLEALDLLPGLPDAIFVGGGVSAVGLLDAAWRRLRPGGKLVANAVTAASAGALERFQQAHGGELIRISIEYKSSEHSLFEEKAPITQYIGLKPLENNV